MTDYQRGLLRAAEICDGVATFGLSANAAGDAIRAEAEKNADGHPQVNAGELATGESQQAGCKGVPSAPSPTCDKCGTELVQCCPTCMTPWPVKIVYRESAPDEALIEEIARRAQGTWIMVDNLTVREQVAWAIREYLKRREGK